jgi:hypothetical protein
MPAPIPDELQTEINAFVKAQEEFLATPKGAKLRDAVHGFAQASLSGKLDTLPRTEQIAGAQAALDWIARLPDKLVTNDSMPIIDLRELDQPKAAEAIRSVLQIVVSGAQALMLGGGKRQQLNPDALHRIAFGGDKASRALGDPFSDPLSPLPKFPDGFEFPDLGKLMMEFAMNKFFHTFLICGAEAAERWDWAEQCVEKGTIARMSSNHACAGDDIELTFEGFGVSPPPAGYDIEVAFPREGGCSFQSVRAALNPWKDRGVVTVKLPQGIKNGCIGFFLVPPRPTSGACEPLAMSRAGGMLQSSAGKYFGGYGALLTQPLVSAAGKIELGNQRIGIGELNRKCAACRDDGANRIYAGPPVIRAFTASPQGPIYPRGSIELDWEAENADTITIVAEDVNGSENKHELPPVIVPPGTPAGTVHLSIVCTRNWTGAYVLRATNQNGCGAAEARITLSSGFSHYLIGVGKANITPYSSDLGMLGFAYEAQKTNLSDGIDLPLYARAFVMVQNTGSSKASRIAIVVADIWSCTQYVKTKVAERLANRLPGSGYSAENVLICGTHTHSGPGGYSEYELYNLTIGGFDQTVSDIIIDGIVDSIVFAHRYLKPGRILVNKGLLKDCGGNRSCDAFRRNPEYNPNDPATDQEMVLLKFVHDDGARAIGALNWFALHPTSLGMFNSEISGDNKGWASQQFEEDQAKRKNPNFVAAFANAAAGDVSGNMNYRIPIGKPPDEDGYLEDKARMLMLAGMQSDTAKELFDTATEELDGEVAFSYTHVNMAFTQIAGTGDRTWPAALGVSFGAGSSEDSLALAVLGPEKKVPSFIVEGINKTEFDAGGREAAVMIAVTVILISMASVGAAGSLIASIAQAERTLVALLPAIAALNISDRQRAWVMNIFAFIGLLIKIGGQLPKDANGIKYDWIVPAPLFMDLGFIRGHGEKPIMYPVGMTTIRAIGSGNNPEIQCPMVPNVVPIQLLKLGTLVIAGIPGEITTIAARRLKIQLGSVFGAAMKHVAVCGYSNAYSGYVTTPEEYDSQQYEGASTLYGPHTLAAYLQEFKKLAAAILNRAAVAPGSPALVPAKFWK